MKNVYAEDSHCVRRHVLTLNSVTNMYLLFTPDHFNMGLTTVFSNTSMYMPHICYFTSTYDLK